MNKDSGWIIGLLTLLLAAGYGCRDQGYNVVDSAQDRSAGPAVVEGKAHARMQQNFRTHLKGGNEVPAVETNAQGQATFQVSADGTSIHYKLIVSNIENVLMSHIHNARAGVNGGVVVWLYPSAPPPQLIEGRFQGVLAEGTITEDDLVGGLAGQSLEDLIEEIEAGNAYVNVHTTQHPGGEIRGQIF